MKLFVDLLRAAALTLSSGVAVLFAEGLSNDLFGRRPWSAPVFWVAIAASIAAGVTVLVRRHRDAIVPIIAIYVVVMFAVLLYLGFALAWCRGQVEF